MHRHANGGCLFWSEKKPLMNSAHRATGELNPFICDKGAENPALLESSIDLHDPECGEDEGSPSCAADQIKDPR
jgi:hypothetical protein